MKKIVILLTMLLCGFTCFAQSKMYVKNDGNSALVLHSEPKLFSKSTTKVAVGTEVNVLKTSQDGKWVYIEVAARKSQNGWTPKNLLSQRKPSTVNSASAKELALAGKGMTTEEFENIYSQSGDGNFETVDIIESFNATQESLNTFIDEGKLNGGEK